jgi:hypothetical protein
MANSSTGMLRPSATRTMSAHFSPDRAPARAHLWQIGMLSCSVSEVDRQITIFPLAATSLACSAVMRSKHPDGQQP